MEKDANLYNLTQQVQGTMFQAGQKQYLASLNDEEREQFSARPVLLQVRAGYAESIGWMLVQLLEFDPEALTVENFRKRAEYSAPRLSQALLELIVSEQWADRIGEEYRFTDAGRSFMKQLMDRRSQMFANFEPLPLTELEQLLAMSNRIIESSLQRGDDKATWCLRYSQKRNPQNACAIAQLIHACSDFNAFRDDAHMSGYHDQGVDGMTWEAFSFICDGQATNAGELFAKLAYRGWTTHEWQNALNHLSGRGWIKGDQTAYTVTDEGYSVRNAVERKTNDVFYAPWSILSNDEQIEYVHLVNKLNDTCMALLSE